MIQDINKEIDYTDINLKEFAEEVKSYYEFQDYKIITHDESKVFKILDAGTRVQIYFKF